MPRPAPTPALRRRSPALLFLAAFFSGAAGANAALPWRTVQLFDENNSIAGYEFPEGMAQIVLGALCLLLFSAAFVVKAPQARRRMLGAAALLVFGLALVPLELIARSAWAGEKNVLILGAGYVGWSLGLYLSLVAGFAASATGSLAASDVLRPAGPAPIKARLPRRSGPPPSKPAP
ncbi:MAG TPA: hypothetical protein VNM14_21535 [Planctomycetota bacterium]|nr:hypothetical protein [Planctomycetota bacterium]